MRLVVDFESDVRSLLYPGQALSMFEGWPPQWFGRITRKPVPVIIVSNPTGPSWVLERFKEYCNKDVL
jgi:hypothetical protein